MNIKRIPEKTTQSIISSTQFASPLLIASFVGILTGFVVVGFVKVIDFAEHLFFHQAKDALSGLGIFALILIPFVGGLFVGPLVHFFAPEAKGHGVPEVMKAIALKGGKIRPRVVFIKAIASALSIGSGASVGREGPIVQIGSALGSFVGQIFNFTQLKVKNLVACGAAAGIAGVFNTPIAGVMFALEVILRDFGARAMSTVVVAAVSASIVSRIFLGETPAFIVPIYQLVNPYEIILYLVLGFLSAIAAYLFISVLHKSEAIWEKWNIPGWIKPAIGGLFIGILGIFVPQIFGSGLETIGEALRGSLELKLLILLIFAKIFATSLSLGSGSSGGVFAPALFIGAVLGGAFGFMIQTIAPFNTAPSGAYALVGMASVFAASAHAPVTAILIVFEMTGDYQIILPLMITTVFAVSVSQKLRKESIYTIKLKEKGIDFDSMEGTAFLGAMQVADVMTKEFQVTPKNTSAKEILTMMAENSNQPIYVIDAQKHLSGMIHRDEVQTLIFEKDADVFVADDLAHPVTDTCAADDVLSDVAKQMSAQHLSQITVMDAHDHEKIVGVLKSEDIFHAVTTSTEKRDVILNRIEPQAGDADGAIQRRFIVSSSSPIVGKELKDLILPKGVVFISIQRKGKSLIPEGHTQLKSKDKVWAVSTQESENSFEEWLKENQLKSTDIFQL